MHVAKPILVLMVAVLLAGGDLAGESDRAHGVPAQLGNEAFPLAWVAADIAVAQSGELRKDVLKGRAVTLLEHEAALLRQSAARNLLEAPTSTSREPSATDCGLVLVPPQNGAAADSPEELVSQSPTIVEGRIEAIREGFYHGYPGSMLRLGATYLKGSPPQKGTFVFYPSARIKVGGSFLCATPPPNYPPPQVGDKLLVFTHGQKSPIYDGSAVLWPVVPKEVLYVESDGRTIGPDALRSLAGDGQQTVERIRTVVKAPPLSAVEGVRP